MFRHWLILGAACLAATAFDQRDRARRPNREGDDGQKVILVVSDGLRWREVFTGADSALLFGDPAVLGGNAEASRAKFWRSSVAERRAALMPFVWGTIARQGVLRGNRLLSSDVDVTNPMWFSYPGYNEMLVGAPDPRIDRNDFGPNPNVTVFEWLNRQREFRGRVAAFGTWEVFQDIFNVGRSRLPVHTTPDKPFDHRVQSAALAYLEKATPRALFVGFAETDDWGHQGRYDRFLAAVHDVDRYIAELWSAVQQHPDYRNRTTIIFTADHGRGHTAADWRHHNRDVPGSGESFIVTIGPGPVAAGEARNTRNTLGDVARLTAAAVGLTYAGEKVAATRGTASR